jgi:hypothetical protein
VDELLFKELSIKPKVTTLKYVDRDTDVMGESVRIYYSQPFVQYAQGEVIRADRVKVKIADFGKGISAIALTVSEYVSGGRRDSPDERVW